MARFLLTTLPTDDLGLITRSLPIGRELRRRGHEVLTSNPARAPRKLIAEAGFENVLPDHPLFELMGCRPGLAGVLGYLRSGAWRRRHRHVLGVVRELLAAAPLRRAPPADEVWSMDHAAAMFGMLDAGFVRAGCRAMLDVIRRCSPDVVVDFWNPFAAVAARAAGKPLVAVIQADAHPLARGFVWWKEPPASRPSCAPALNRVLRELGLPPITRLEDLSVGDLTLVVGSPSTDPLPPEARVTYLGLTLWEPEGAALPPRIEALGARRPLVWIYGGNPRYGAARGVFDSAVVLEAAVEALSGEDLDVLVTTGHHPVPPALLPLPGNFRHEPFLPALALARRCRALVHHGGYGSCQTGLAAGVPAVVLPTSSERESNARRLAAVGAAIHVEVASRRGRKVVDPASLRSAVRRVLAEPGYAERARAEGARLRALGGPGFAAELIEQLARRDQLLGAVAPR